MITYITLISEPYVVYPRIMANWHFGFYIVCLVVVIQVYVLNLRNRRFQQGDRRESGARCIQGHNGSLSLFKTL